MSGARRGGLEARKGGRTFSIALLVIALVGVVLRLGRLGHGLPDFLEEAIPLRVSLEMWGWGSQTDDLNPHMFQYPSLTIYLHYVIQKLCFSWGTEAGQFRSPADFLLGFVIDPSPSVRASRLLGILADGVSIFLVGRLAGRFGLWSGGAAAALVALSPTMIVTSSSILTDNVMTALALGALAWTTLHFERGDRRSMVGSAAMIGLAAGAKYPAFCLMLPLAWVLWRRAGFGAWGSFAAAGAIAATAFLVTTPFALMDARAFLTDLFTALERTATGHLGAVDRTGILFYSQRVLDNLGWPGFLACLASLSLIRWNPFAVLLWLALMGFALPTVTARAEFERYLVPIIPCMAILAAGAFQGLVERSTRYRGIVVTLGCLAFLAPAGYHTIETTRATTSTQQQAREWFERHLSADDLILQEPYGAQVMTRARRDQIIATSLPAYADFEIRERFMARPWFRAVAIPFVAAGPNEIVVGRENVQVVRHAVDLNRPCYDVRFLQGVDYVLTSSAVRGRFEADSERFSAQREFYRFLDQHADSQMVFRPGHGVQGPELRLYRLGSTGRSRVIDREPLDPAWWTKGFSHPQALQIGARLGRPGLDHMVDSARDREWAVALQILYERWYAPFVRDLVMNLGDLKRCDHVRGLALHHLELQPSDAGVLAACGQCGVLAPRGSGAGAHPGR